MKKLLSIIIISALLAMSLTACGGSDSADNASGNDAQVTTTQESAVAQVEESESKTEPASVEEIADESQSDDSGFKAVTDSDTEFYYSADDPSVLGKLNTYCTEGGLGNKTVTVTGRLEYLLQDPNGGTLVFWDSEDTVFCPAPAAAKGIYDQYGEMMNCLCTIKITFSDTPISYTYIDGSYQQKDGLSYVTDVEIVSYKQM